MFDLLSSIRNRRVVARNYRILSALDDATLEDIGLDRNALYAFCENDCQRASRPTRRLHLLLAGLWPEPLKPTIR